MLSSRSSLSSGQIFLPLPEALEKFVAFAAAAHQNVFVLEHGFDDAQDGLGTKIIGAIKSVHGFEYFVLAQARIFESALLETVVLDQVGLVFLDEPPVLAGHLEEFGPGIRRGEGNLDAEHIQLLGKADGVLD